MCARMMEPGWNPPVWAMRRWIKICLMQYWAHPKNGKIICLKLLNLSKGERALDKMCKYGQCAQSQVQQAI